MDEERYAKIEPYLWVDSTAVATLRINQLGLKELLKHPYMDYYVARDVVRLRQQGIRVEDAEALRALPSMTDSCYDRLLPYLSFE